MKKSRNSVAKNAGVMMVSQMITWAMSMLLTFFLPRYLGAEAVGKFQLASSLWAVLSILISFGMDTLLTKEIARDRGSVRDLLATSLGMRVALFGLSFVVMMGIVRAAGYSAETVAVVNILAFSTLSWQLTGAIAAVLQGLERMEYISLSDIFGKMAATIFSIVALLLGFGVEVVAWVHVFSAVVSLLIQLDGLRRSDGLHLALRLDRIGWMLKSSLPYLLVSGFLVAYSQVDVIIISMLIDEKQVGWYAAASRLYGTFLFVPTVLITALFPVFSRIHKADPQELPTLVTRSIDLSLLLGVPIGFGITAVANPMIVLLFGEAFAPAGPILAVMGLVVVCTYLNTLFGKYFVSVDRQNLWTWVMGIMLLVTIPLDILLVPLCQRVFGVGALGGAFSYLITEGLMVLIGLYFLPSGLLGWKNGWYALRVIAAGSLMAGVAWTLRGWMIIVPVTAGALVYAGLLLLFGLVSKEDMNGAYTQLLSKLRRARLEKVESA